MLRRIFIGLIKTYMVILCFEMLRESRNVIINNNVSMALRLCFADA